MVFSINSTVCIAPEALPLLHLSSFEYATITKIDEARGRITLRRIGTGGSWRQKTVDQDLDSIVEVPHLEPTQSRLHASRRTFVAFLEEGIILLGQIRAVQEGSGENPQHQVEVQAGTGTRWVPSSDTVELMSTLPMFKVSAANSKTLF